jgi:hypothetical protein
MAPKVEKLSDAHARLEGFRGKPGFDAAAIDRAEAELERRQKLARHEALERATDLRSGALLALEDYATRAADLGEQAEQAMTRSLGGIEDAFVSLRKTGEFNFAALADAVVDDITRMAIRATIIAPILNAAGVYFGGAGRGSETITTGTSGSSGVSTSSTTTRTFHDGGTVGNGAVSRYGVDPDLWADARRYHGGGLVGDELPIIARRGEQVLTREQAAARGDVTVNVINQSGTPLQATQRRTGNGEIEVILTGMMRQAVARGALDDVLNARLGTTTKGYR